MLEVLQFIFQDVTHFTGALLLVLAFRLATVNVNWKDGDYK
jgi:hypothetical protein